MSGLQQIGLWSVLILTLLVGVTSMLGSVEQPEQQPQARAALHCVERSVQASASTSPCSPGL
ncbi:hypothetical protein ACXYTP_25320, partial [Tsukamurella ocularis]